MPDFTPLQLSGPLPHPLLERDVTPVLNRTLELLLSKQFRGIDPGSYYSHNLRRFRAGGPGLAPRAWNKLLNLLVSWGGNQSVRLLNLPEITSTKAAALTLAGLSRLRGQPDLCDQQQLLRLAEGLITWLLARRSDQIHAWTPDFVYEIQGQPITQSVLGTINTVFCADALWQWRDSFSFVDDAILTAGQACHHQLPRLEDEKYCCFSYNPLATYYVHNSNLFIALLLARCHFIAPSEMVASHLVEKCIHYTLDDFQNSGSLRYAGPPTVNNTVDNYHIGFVIRTLADLQNHVQNIELRERIKKVIDTGLVQYRNSFIKPDGVVKFENNKHHIQAHSVAEALLLYSRFKHTRPELFDTGFKQSVQKSLYALWNRYKDQFDSEARAFGSISFWRNTAPMPRWAWGWLLNSLILSSENNIQ